MRMVTRTIKTVNAKVKLFDSDTNEVITEEFCLTGCNDDFKSITRAVNKIIKAEQRNVKFLCVESKNVALNKFVMEESKFIQNATIA